MIKKNIAQCILAMEINYTEENEQSMMLLCFSETYFCKTTAVMHLP